MPKPMLKTPQQNQQGTVLNITDNQLQKQQTQQMDKMKLDKLLRQPRSKAYMDALHKLDAGGHTRNQNKVNDIINAIKKETNRCIANNAENVLKFRDEDCVSAKF